MIAIILAAGTGKRLMPLTKDIPKTLIEVNGKTILESTIKKCFSNGIEKFVVIVGHKKETVVKECNIIKMKLNVDICLVENVRYLDTNTAYSLSIALDHIFDDILIINGDNIFDELIIKNLLKTDNTALVIDNVKVLTDESFKVVLNGTRIEHMGKDLNINKSTGEFIGISKINIKKLDLFKSKLQMVLNNNPQQYYDIAFEEFSKVSVIDVLYTNGLKWTEIDTLDDLETAKKLNLN